MNNLECVCCGSGTMLSLWDLPQLPLTGIYVSEWNSYSFENYHDESLLFCKVCTHLQLSNAVDSKLLYQETYSHRTSSSEISTRGNAFLEGYIRKAAGERQFEQILEIGCNDGLLLRQISDLSKHLSGFDPVLDQAMQSNGNVRLAGGFGETIEYSGLLESPIDLVLSAHTFEHIQDPRITIQRLEPYLSAKAEFIIEVPSSISMINQARLDQVFPQHVNHYTPESMSALLSPLGFKLMEVVHNYKYWGGTQILRFTRNSIHASIGASRALKENDILDAISHFKDSMRLVATQLQHGEFQRVALGAAQMLPILNYHIGEIFQDLDCILDDNPARAGKFFPGIEIPICTPADFKTDKELQILITALDSSKALVPRALEIGASSVIIPVGII